MKGSRRSDGMEAGYIESPFGPLFVCFHPPRGGSHRDAAVLFCDPFGSDRMNLHRAYRAFALHVASLGFPALRVDYPGTCDSAGTPRDPGHFRSWRAALDVAADFLLRETGVSELGLFGALLGGTLATVCAASRDDVTALALWGPHASGRTFLHEQRALHRLAGTNRTATRPVDHRPGDQEAIGFLISEETSRELASLDALSLTGPIVRSAALFPRNRTSSVAPFAEHLRRSGASVQVQREAVFDMDLLVNDAAPLPTRLVDEVGAFFSATFPDAPAKRSRAFAPALARETLVDGREGFAVRESVASFGSDGDLFGIVTTSPVPAPTDRPAVLLVNGGHNHRAGINRNYTEWARDWAALGFTVMRMDIRGLGDSPPDPRAASQVLYRDETRKDLMDAMDHLEARYGARSFVAIGLCAGGYQAFHTALVDPRIVGLAMLNPLRFGRLADSAPVNRGEHANATLEQHLRSIADPAAWRRLVSMRRDPRPLARAFATKLARRVAMRARRLAFSLSPEAAPPASWLSGAFLALIERGCRVLVVFNANEAMAPVLDEQTGPDREWLERGGRFRVERIPDADHIFSPIASQQRVERLLREALCSWAGDVPSRAATSEGPRRAGGRV